MNDTIGSYCGYTGKVTIQIRKKIGECGSPYFFHNSGTKRLFDTIARGLCGENIADELPTYLDVYTYDDDGVFIGSLLKHSLSFSGTVWGEPAGATNNDGRILFKTLLTKADIGYQAGVKKHYIVLLNKSKEILCQVPTNLDWLSEVNDSSDALILWSLIFSNTESDNTGSDEVDKGE